MPCVEGKRFSGFECRGGPVERRRDGPQRRSPRVLSVVASAADWRGRVSFWCFWASCGRSPSRWPHVFTIRLGLPLAVRHIRPRHPDSCTTVSDAANRLSGQARVSRGRRARRCRQARPGDGRESGRPATGCRPSPPPSCAAWTAGDRSVSPAGRWRPGLCRARATLAWVSARALRSSRSVISSAISSAAISSTLRRSAGSSLAITSSTSSAMTVLLLYPSSSRARCRSNRSSALRIGSR